MRLTTGRGGHGIVSTSQEEWKKFLEWVDAGKRKGVDFSDASIMVDFLRDSGHISHSHINPVLLEKYEPQTDDMDFDVLLAASGMYQGNETLCGSRSSRGSPMIGRTWRRSETTPKAMFMRWKRIKTNTSPISAVTSLLPIWRMPTG